jgi:hypothetical protein
MFPDKKRSIKRLSFENITSDNLIDQMKLNLSNERVLLTKELITEREEEIKLKEDEQQKRRLLLLQLPWLLLPFQVNCCLSFLAFQ